METHFKINTTTFQKGIYLVRINNEYESTLYKLIVQ